MCFLMPQKKNPHKNETIDILHLNVVSQLRALNTNIFYVKGNFD